MTRPLVLALFALILTAISGALAVMFGWSTIPIVPGVLLCAYAAIVDPPIQAALGASLIGLVIDALSGTPLGVNVIACVAVLSASRFVVSFVPLPRGLPSFLFVGGFSGVWAFLALLLLYLFQSREGFGFGAMFATAIVNAVASVVVFPVLSRILVLLRLEEKGETLQERLASKGSLVK
jgi:hypothetical protein